MISRYDYVLPKELIAQRPLKKRSDSRLMVVGSRIQHRHFRDIINYLRRGDVLVINESKVIPAKLLGTKATGGKIAAILTKRVGTDYEAIIKGKVHANEILGFRNFSARVISKNAGLAVLRFSPRLTDAALNRIGRMPIPPYVKAPLCKPSCYQTVYATKKGSVAAHTAGLHFTPSLLRAIERKGVKLARVCLHISFATFFPIRGSLKDHKMYPECCSIGRKDAIIINSRKARLFAVGTTTVKTLESLADSKGNVVAGSRCSDLFIYPGYKFKTRIDAMITNFHLPKSALLLLVCAYYGRARIFIAYAEAIKRKYRFYSFGDAMLLIK
jgi:S-adenosylmethionine:tRNA ribosyltransferase-isomerase